MTGFRFSTFATASVEAIDISFDTTFGPGKGKTVVLAWRAGRRADSQSGR